MLDFNCLNFVFNIAYSNPLLLVCVVVTVLIVVKRSVQKGVKMGWLLRFYWYRDLSQTQSIFVGLRWKYTAYIILRFYLHENVYT